MKQAEPMHIAEVAVAIVTALGKIQASSSCKAAACKMAAEAFVQALSAEMLEQSIRATVEGIERKAK